MTHSSIIICFRNFRYFIHRNEVHYNSFISKKNVTSKIIYKRTILIATLTQNSWCFLVILISIKHNREHKKYGSTRIQWDETRLEDVVVLEYRKRSLSETDITNPTFAHRRFTRSRFHAQTLNQSKSRNNISWSVESIESWSVETCLTCVAWNTSLCKLPLSKRGIRVYFVFFTRWYTHPITQAYFKSKYEIWLGFVLLFWIID